MKNHPTLARIGRTILIFSAIVITNLICIAVVELSFRYTPVIGIVFWLCLILGLSWWYADGRDK